MPIDTLYTAAVLGHNRNPRRYGDLGGAVLHARGHNASCGDLIEVDVALDGGRLVDWRFRGEACAVAIAAASMLDALPLGNDRDGLQRLRDRIDGLVAGADPVEDYADLGELAPLSALRAFPGRRKCALLPIATLCAAVDRRGETRTEDSDA